MLATLTTTWQSPRRPAARVRVESPACVWCTTAPWPSPSSFTLCARSLPSCQRRIRAEFHHETNLAWQPGASDRRHVNLGGQGGHSTSLARGRRAMSRFCVSTAELGLGIGIAMLLSAKHDHLHCPYRASPRATPVSTSRIDSIRLCESRCRKRALLPEPNHQTVEVSGLSLS